jgi:ParB/RepB/Spo0J family partition protein
MTAAAAVALTSATIPLAQLRESPFNPRTQFLDTDMEELQASIAAHGVVQPILVRPIDTNLYEIVAGHRRTRAAKAAKLTEIPATVRAMTDAEARQVQLIENAQRVDLAPLDEAEAYAALLETGLGLRDLAKTLSRKPSEIASRLTLVHLPQTVKVALASGLLPVEHAELIGRIPDEALQDQALTRFTTEHSLSETKRVKGVVPLAVARRIVETEFMTVLANAPFDPEDPTLSPLGKCSTCPARSGNNRDLFGDVRGKNVCTNLADFRLKVTAYLTRLREEGCTVLLSPAEIREAFPYATAHPSDRYIDLDRPCHDDPKQRTYDALLSDETKKSIVYVFLAGRLWRLFPRDLLAQALESSGHTFLQKRMERTPDPAQRESAHRAHRANGRRHRLLCEGCACQGAAIRVDRSPCPRGPRRPELDHRRNTSASRLQRHARRATTRPSQDCERPHREDERCREALLRPRRHDLGLEQPADIRRQARGLPAGDGPLRHRCARHRQAGAKRAHGEGPRP